MKNRKQAFENKLSKREIDVVWIFLKIVYNIQGALKLNVTPSIELSNKGMVCYSFTCI